ncbi:MAG: NOB1 family endonuclease [archaeon]
MIKIMDASAVINAYSLQENEEMYTTPSVIEELKNIASKSLAESALAKGKLEVVSPKEEDIKEIKKKAREVGSEDHLSETDIDVLALALEKKGELITDDYTMQNLAAHLNIKYRGVTRGEIRKKKKFK